jgi:predicted MFS family arabinose efflux permease
VALNSSSFNATRVVGPAIAGVVLSVLGAAWCFLLNGLSYVAVLWGLAAMDMPDTAAATLPPRSALANMAEGLRHVWRDTRMRAVILLLAVLVIFGSPFLVLLPILARDVLGRGAVAYGWMMAAVGAGALAGALWIASYGRRLPRGAVMLRSAALYAILLMVLALQATLPAVLLTLAALGCVMIVNGAIANTLLQTLAPDPLRGRIISVYTLVAIGFSPLGAILAGGIGDTLGVEAALVLGGVVCLVGALVVGVALRGLRETR